ncbi:MAG: IPT/TIG domain-containing protein [Bacteroidota bacterium]
MPTINTGEKVIYEENINDEQYSKDISSTLEENKEYFVRAFIETDDLIVYGNQVKFISLGGSAPILSDFFPEAATLGDTINLYGENFSYISNDVKFNETKANVISISDTLLKVVIPDELEKAKNYITISIKNNSFTQQEKSFNILKPNIINITPPYAKSGDTVEINAENIGSNVNHISLSIKKIATDKIDRWKIIDISNYNKKSVKFIIPNSLDDKNKLKIRITDIEDSITFDYLKPKILSYPSDSSYWNDTLTFKTQNFYNNPNRYSISLNNKDISPTIASDSIVKIKVPKDLDKITNILNFNIAGFSFNHEFKLKQPMIEGINLDSINFGDTVIIEGNNFHPSNNKIRIEDKFDIEPIFQSSTLVKFVLPDRDNFPFQITMTNYENLSLKVVARPNIISNQISSKLIKPHITSISNVNNGQEITLRGYNLNEDAAIYLNSRFNFGSGISASSEYNSSPIVIILEQSENEVKFKIDFNNELKLNRWYQDFSFTVDFKIGLRSNGYSLVNPNEFQMEFDKKYSFFDNSIFNLEYDRKREYPQLLSHSEKGFMIGGYGLIPPKWSRREYLRDFYEFNPTTKKWNRLQNWSTFAYQNIDIRLSFIKNDGIYIITDNRHFIKYDFMTASWIEKGILPEVRRIDGHFTISNKDYIITAYEIYELDLEDGTIDSLGYLPYDSGFDIHMFRYSFKQNNKVRIIFDNKEYELDESTFEWDLISQNKIPETQQIFNHNNNTYYLDNTGLYNRVTNEAIEIFPYQIDEIKLLFLFDDYLVFRQNNNHNIIVNLNE